LDLLYLLFGVVALLDWEESLVSLDIGLVLSPKGEEEIIEEVIPDLFPLVFYNIRLLLLLSGLLFFEDLLVLFFVLLLQFLKFVTLQDILGSWPEVHLVKADQAEVLVHKLTEHIVDLD